MPILQAELVLLLYEFVHGWNYILQSILCSLCICKRHYVRAALLRKKTFPRKHSAVSSPQEGSSDRSPPLQYRLDLENSSGTISLIQMFHT